MDVEPTSHEILARTSHLTAKALVIRHPQDVVVTSPYLATPGAELPVVWADKASTVIVTTFDAETFATRASDLRTVKRLVEAGYHVRALPGLHAKVVIAGDAAIVGSQNLTNRGRKNKEATVLIRDAEAIEKLRADIARWLEDSFRITTAMIVDMEVELEELRDLTAKMNEFRKRARQANRMLKEQREGKGEAQPEPAPLEPEQPPEIPPVVPPVIPEPPDDPEPTGPTTVPTMSVPGSGEGGSPGGGRSARDRTAAAASRSVKLREDVPMRITSGEKVVALACRNGKANLLDWAKLMSGNAAEEFERRDRYLVLCPETGRIAWAIINKHRFSRFSYWRPGATAGSATRPTILGMPIRVEANRTPEATDWNLRFTLFRRQGTETFVFDAVFLHDSLDVLRVTGPERQRGITSMLARQTGDPDSDTYKTLVQAVFTPFRHDRNSDGGPADEFCTGLPGVPVLRLRRAGNHTYFAVESPGFDASLRQETPEAISA